jgi:hypothetical protein
MYINRYKTNKIYEVENYYLIMLPYSQITKLEVGQMLNYNCEVNAEILLSSKMNVRWNHSSILRHKIIFEDARLNPNYLEDLSLDEPEVYIKERVNPFNAPFLVKKNLNIEFDLRISTADDFLNQLIRKMKLKALIVPGITSTGVTRREKYSELRNSYYFYKLKECIKIIIKIPQFFIKILKERSERNEYYKSIECIKKTKEIILDFNYGGLGDVLVFSSLPRLLFQQYGVKFYLDEQTQYKFRHNDFGKLCFELNPYFNGYKNRENSFSIKFFAYDIGFWGWVFGRGLKNLSISVEEQFLLSGDGLPEIFYEPSQISKYESTILIDRNRYTGEKMGLVTRDECESEMISKLKGVDSNLTVEYVEQGAQDIFSYVDMIYSSKYFICHLSGGNSLAAAMKKNAIIILPTNLNGSALMDFLYLNCNKYIK